MPILVPLVVERVQRLPNILLRDLGVSRRCLHVCMPELRLRHAQALSATKQFRTARVTKRVRMQRGYPSPSAGGSDDLPNPLTRNPTLDGLTNFVRVRDHEEWSHTCRVRSLSRNVVAEDHARPRRQ